MLAILISIALASLDTAIANTALPAIATSLHTTPAASVWIINAYQLSAVATILAFASFGGVIGHRKIYLFGLVLFTVSSALCAMSSTLIELTLARVLQGVGASAIMSVNAALIFSLFPPEKLGKGMGLNALVVGMSFAAGPTVASLILSVATWPWLFGVNIPIGLIALAMAIPSLPHTPPNGQRFAWRTAGLSVVTFGSLIYALGEGAQFAGTLPICLALLVCVCAGSLMLRRAVGPHRHLLFRHPGPGLCLAAVFLRDGIGP